MGSLTRAISYLIAAQTQAVALIGMAWLAGEWLNEHHPIGVDWYAITFPVAILAVAQLFYLLIRHALALGSQESRATERKGKKESP